jgi:hypothetical protein
MENFKEWVLITGEAVKNIMDNILKDWEVAKEHFIIYQKSILLEFGKMVKNKDMVNLLQTKDSCYKKEFITMIYLINNKAKNSLWVP